MTTYIIYPDNTDGTLSSHNASLSATQAGSNIIVDTSLGISKTGMNSGGGEYYMHQNFVSYDTSVIVDAEEIVDATISIYSYFPVNQSIAWGQQFRAYNWTSPLTSAQWQTPTAVNALPLVANVDYLFPSTPYQWRVTGRDTLVSGISKTAATKFVIVANTFAAGAGINGVQEIWTQNSRGDTANRPYMTVYTTALSTFNGVTMATTSLPDGTNVSLRSDGAASPTITLGYTPLNGSWTSIGTIDASFDKTVDGAGTLTLTNDPAGNIFIVGLLAGTTGTIAAQAYTRQTSTTWSVGPVLSQALPRGNEQTVRSVSSTYMTAGTDSTDMPSIYAMVARGSGGNRPGFPYHVPGAGYPHGLQISPVALLNGSGTLFYNVGDTFIPSPACGVPAFVDSVALDSNIRAIYVQRGKFGSTTVGGISVYRKYGANGFLVSQNNEYIPTGSSKLVKVSSTVFAHVFDNNGTTLSIRFYNTNSQVLGETTIPAGSFYGGSIGTQWTAHYDKVAAILRVYYMAAAGSTTLNRFDVSPSTFIGTTTAAVSTTFGSAGSINSILRTSQATDERFAVIQSANNAAGTLSTQVYNSTVGNLAPNAPALTTRQNFDANSAATFTWTPGDTNPADYQTKYDLEISRVSDSVVVYAPATVVSTVSSASVPASSLANGINYRWRVRTYDVSATAGAWSGYGTFSTAAVGTLNITAPATDNLTGIDTSTYTVTWTYVNAGGQTQAQRRVRVIRTSDSAVISDTTMQVNTTASYAISSMESGKEYRIEVSLVNSGSVSVPVVTRLITPSYSAPMTPTFVLNPKDSYIEVVTTNPAPSGDRPQVIYNDVYKRRSGSGAVDSDFVRIATILNSASYRDYAVKSGTNYDYRIVGRTS